MTDEPVPFISVDAEALARRLAGVTDGDLRTQIAAVVEATLALLGSIQRIDFGVLRQPAAARESPGVLWRQLSTGFVALWTALDHYEQQMQRLATVLAADGPLASGHPETSEAQGAVAADLEIEPGIYLPTNSGHSTPRSWKLPRRIVESTLASRAVLRADTDKLRQHLPTLTKASSSWDLIAALQKHLGAVTATAGGLLTTLYANLPPAPGEDADAERRRDADTALQTRQLFVALRRELEPAVEQLQDRPVGEWEAGLRRIHQILDRFVFGPAFPWMRAFDKRRLVELVFGIEQLVSLWSPVRQEHAHKALEALHSFVAGLLNINYRRCVIEHDIAMLQRALAELGAAEASAAAGKRERIGAAIAALSRLDGLDPALDRLLEQALSPLLPFPMQKLKARAATVLARLQQGPDGTEED